LRSAVDETGHLRKNYPEKQTQLTKFNCARAATYEMIVRVEDVKNHSVVFDENFGAGAKNYLAMNYIFYYRPDFERAHGAYSCQFRLQCTLPIVQALGGGEQQDRIARARVFHKSFLGHWRCQ